MVVGCLAGSASFLNTADLFQRWTHVQIRCKYTVTHFPPYLSVSRWDKAIKDGDGLYNSINIAPHTRLC